LSGGSTRFWKNRVIHLVAKEKGATLWIRFLVARLNYPPSINAMNSKWLLLILLSLSIAGRTSDGSESGKTELQKCTESPKTVATQFSQNQEKF
jgi:hypothetical protein